MEDQELIEQLKSEGYDSVFVWNGHPGESDPDHTHPFETRLIVREGELTIGMDGVNTVLKKGDVIIIPKEKLHSGLAGQTGCKYIVAEKR